MTKYALAVLLSVLAVLALLAGTWGHGYQTGWEKRDVEAVNQIAEINERLIEAERRATANREKGRIVADRLASELAEARSSITTLQERIDHEIRRTASATRRCMSGDLAGLLNRLSPIREHVHPAGAAPAGTDAQAPAPAADPGGPPAGYVSERAVAEALRDARGGYESCRTQLHKLIDWAGEVTRGD